MGKKLTPNEDLRQAFAGHMVAEFDHVDDEESVAERQSGQPHLEIYNPVLQPWYGEVVAVSEFYEMAGFFLLLSAIVLRGSKTTDRQRSILGRRVEELTKLLRENKSLTTRVQKASQETAALNERYLRRIAADLHDGPAQQVPYAFLRVDSDITLEHVGVDIPGPRCHTSGIECMAELLWSPVKLVLDRASLWQLPEHRPL